MQFLVSGVHGLNATITHLLIFLDGGIGLKDGTAEFLTSWAPEVLDNKLQTEPMPISW